MRVVQIVFAELFDEDRVGAAQEVGEFLADFAEDADAETGSREGMAVDHLTRQTQLDAELAHFVLEQLAQRLDELQIHLFGEPTHIVVGLDHVRLARATARGFNHVRIDRALREKLHAAEFLRLFVEDFDKQPPMILRLASGSVTPASAARKRASASTRMTRTPRCSANVLMTWSPSLRRSRPWSTKTQTSWFPIAR